MNKPLTDFSQLETYRFIRKEDVGDQTIVTISKYDRMNVAPKDAPEEIKPVVWFLEFDRPLVLNKTRIAELTAAFGHKLADSIGKQVELWVDGSIRFQGATKGGIRLKAVAATKPRASAADVNKQLAEAASNTE